MSGNDTVAHRMQRKTAEAPSTFRVRPLTAQEITGAAGGVGDFSLALDGVQGESSKRSKFE